MLSFEKLVKDEQQTVKMVWDDEERCMRVEKSKNIFDENIEL